MHRVVIALVTLIGLTGAAFVAGYLLLFSSATDRASQLAPADTAVYVNVYLQPSTSQQMNLSELIGRLPGFADDATLDEKVDQVVQNLLSTSGLDYGGQIKPWLGTQIAVAAGSSGDALTGPSMIVFAQVKDRQAAEASVAALVADDGAEFSAETYRGIEIATSTEAAYAFVDDVLVIGPAMDDVRGVVDTFNGEESLADRADFQSTVAELPADHLVSVFVDLAAIAGAADIGDRLSGVSTAGAVLVAERDGLRLSGSAPFDMAEAAASARAGFAMGSAPSSLPDWMPDDTLAEVVIFGLRQTLEDAEDALGSTPEGEELAGTLDTFRALAAFGLGIDLDADILPLLDREVAIAFSGIEDDLPAGQLILRPDDPAAAEIALDRVIERLGAVGATVEPVEVDGTDVTVVTLPDVGDVAYTVVDEIIIMGFGADDVMAAVEAHSSGQTLAANAAYARTFDVAGTRAGNEAFADVGALIELFGAGLALPDDTRDILSQIGTFGLTAPSREDQIEFHMVLTINEPSAQ